jgi:Glycosyl transferase family 11
MILFDMPGGIGNQLFALFAARYIQEQTDDSCTLQFSTIDPKHSLGMYDIRLFQLEKEELTNVFSNFKRGLRFAYYPNNLIMRRAVGIFHNRHIKNFPLNEDRINDVNLFMKSRKWGGRIPLRISGYFGDFGFYDYLPKKRKTLVLQNPSSNFRQLFDFISNSRTLGIHLRLGDYQENWKTVGLLGDQYYSQSLNHMGKNFDHYLVFTNDKPEARRRIRNWRFAKSISVLDEGFINPVEDLVLLSSCSAIITANSTFSFWAAKLSSSQNIIFPREWRKDLTTVVSGIPKTWKSVESYWI